MLNIKFEYKGIEEVIQCKKNERMKEIIKIFNKKFEIDKVYYLYNGIK